MEWNIKSDRPIYVQLVEQIKHFIISGELTPGSKLPSVRDMAWDACVNPNTMQKALSALDDEGLLLPHSTAGRYVTRDLELISHTRDRVARDRLHALMSQLLSLGYSPEEILEISSRLAKEILAEQADRSCS